MTPDIEDRIRYLRDPASQFGEKAREDLASTIEALAAERSPVKKGTRFYTIIDKKRTEKDLVEALNSGAVFRKRTNATEEFERGFDPERTEVVAIEVTVVPS